MRAIVLLMICCLGIATATTTLESQRVTILFDNAELEPYAQAISSRAEAALDILLPLFELEDVAHITLQVSDTTDVYNGYASLLPRPKLTLRALFPVDVNLGYGDDDLTVLLLHEILHLVQLGYNATPEDNRAGLRLGIVGENAAAVPPTWVIEGLATWIESEYSQGGRRDAALTRGLFYSAALDDTWPDFFNLGLSSYSAWPGGLARYHYGAGFLDFLINRYTFEAVLESLRTYNAGGFFKDYSQAWLEAHGVVLADEWLLWRDTIKAEAEQRAYREAALLTDSGWFTAAPALSPDGQYLAWASWPAQLMLAEVRDMSDNLLQGTPLIDRRYVTHLRWLDNSTLIYARPVRSFGTTWNELFSLDIHSREETQLSHEARAFYPNPLPDGCILYVRDAGGAGLQRWCHGATELYWQAAPGQHIIGLDVSPQGQIVMSLWEQGWVNLALLEGQALRYLSQDCIAQLAPSWLDERRIIYEQHGELVDLYQVDISSATNQQLSNTAAGAFSPDASPSGIWYRALGGSGYNIALLDNSDFLTPHELETPAATTDCPEPPGLITAARLPSQTYNPLPSLIPYGWLPGEIGLSVSSFLPHLSADIVAQDDSAKHRYTVRLGADLEREGSLAGVYSYLHYHYAPWLSQTPDLNASPLTFGLQLGAFPNSAPDDVREIIYGLRGSLLSRIPLDRWQSLIELEGGYVYLPSSTSWLPEARARAMLSNQRGDLWGYPSTGWQLAAFARLYATSTGHQTALWATATYHYPLSDLKLLGTLGLKLEGGYHPVFNFPISAQELGTAGSLAYRLNLPLGWHYGDGKYSLERITLEPRVRTYYHDGPGIAADMSVGLDAVLSYNAPISLQFTGGYAEGFWASLGFRF